MAAHEISTSIKVDADASKAKQEMDALANRLKDVYKVLNGDNLDFSKLNDYHNTISKIAEDFQRIQVEFKGAEGMDKLGSCLDQVLAKYKELEEMEALANRLTDVYKVLNGDNLDLNKLNEYFNTISKIVEDYNRMIDDFKGAEGMNKLGSCLEQVIAKYKELEDTFNRMADASNVEQAMNENTSNTKQELDSIALKLGALYKEMQSLNELNKNIDSTQVQNLENRYTELSNALNKVNGVTQEQLDKLNVCFEKTKQELDALKLKVSDSFGDTFSYNSKEAIKDIDEIINKIRELSSEIPKQAQLNRNKTKGNRTPVKDAGNLNAESFKQSTKEVLDIISQINIKELKGEKLKEFAVSLDKYLIKLKEFKKLNGWAQNKDLTFYNSIIEQYNLAKSELRNRKIKTKLEFDYNIDEDVQGEASDKIKVKITDDGAFEHYMQEIRNGNVNEVFDEFVDLFNLIKGASIKSVDSLKAVYDALGPIGIPLALLKETLGAIMGELDDMFIDLNKLNNLMIQLGTDSIDFVIDGLKEVVNIADEAVSKVEELADKGIDLQQGYFTLYNYVGTAGDEVLTFNNNLKDLYNTNSDYLVGQLRGILGMVSNMNLELEQSTDMINAFTMFGLDASAFSGMSFEEVVGQLEGAVNLGMLRRNSPIVQALDMTKEDVELFRQFNSVEERAQFLLSKGEKLRGTYAKWLDTSAGKIVQFNNATENLMNSIIRLATGVFAKVAPLLTMLTNLIEKVVDGLAGLFNIDIKGSKDNQAVDYYDNIASSINGITEATENAERKTASFDDVIQINESSSDSSESEGITDLSFLDNWINDIEKEKTELDKLYDKIIELWEKGDYTGIGKTLAEFFTNKLNDINWADIKKKVEEFTNIGASILNGITNVELLGSIGNTLAESLNTGFDFLYTFASTYDFKNLGVAIGTAWKSFWDGLDSDVIGEAIYEWIIGGFNAIDGLLDTASLSDMTGKIGDIILGFFSNITEEDIVTMANDVIGIIDQVFKAVQTLIDKLKSDPTLKEKLISLIKGIFTGFKDNAEEWGETANELIGGIMEFLAEAISTADSAGLSEGISNFLSGLNLGELLNKYISLKIRTWWIETKAKWSVKLSAFGEVIVEALKTAGAMILFVLTLIISPIIAFFKGLWDGIKGIGSGIISFWDETVAPFFSNIGSKISEIFSAEKWKKMGSDALNALWEGLKSVFSNLKKWLNNNVIDSLNTGFTVPEWVPAVGGKEFKFNIPRLATGGIVTSSTIANIGEAGTEGVLPLTGTQGQAWMGMLADKIVNKLNNKSLSGGAITIDMSGFQKNFYTRSEMIEFGTQIVEALKACGVNLQVAY